MKQGNLFSTLTKPLHNSVLALSIGLFSNACQNEVMESKTNPASDAIVYERDAQLSLLEILEQDKQKTEDTLNQNHPNSSSDTLGDLLNDTLLQDVSSNISTDSSISTENQCPTNEGIIIFKDINLEQAIKEYLKLPPDKGVSVNDGSNITVFEAVGKGITSIEGIQCFSSIEILDLYDNGIADITPIKKLTKLHTFYIRKNEVKDISPVSTLHKLQILYVGFNNITNLSPVYSLPILQELSVENNPLEYSSQVCTIINEIKKKGTKVYGFDFTQCSKQP